MLKWEIVEQATRTLRLSTDVGDALRVCCVQIAGGQRYRPPAVDVNAPDLFIPLMGLWSYALLSCVVLAFKHAFKPESMSSTVSNSQSGVGCGRSRRGALFQGVSTRRSLLTP